MATVPTTTQRTVLPSGANLPYSDSNAGYASTQAINRGLFQAGNAIQQGTDYFTRAMDKLQLEDNQREHRKLDIADSAYNRLLAYGDGTPENPGYLNLRGENAIAAYKDVQKKMDEHRKQLLSSASNQQVKDMFTTSSDVRYEAAMGQLFNHTADERQKANDQIRQAHIDEAMMDASSNFSQPGAIERGMAVIQGEVNSAIVDGTLAKDAAPEKLKELHSQLLDKTITAAILSNSLSTANAYINKYSGEMSGTTLATLKDRAHNQMMQNVSDAARFEAIKEHKLAVTQEQNFGTAVDAYLNHGLSKNGLSELNVSPEHKLRLNALLDEQAKVVGDPVAASRLLADIYENKVGSLEDVIARGTNLTGTDRDQAMALFIQEQRNGGILHSYANDQGRLDVEAAVGGMKDPFGNYTDPNVATRVRNAYEFYNNLLLSGKPKDYAVKQSIEHFRPNLDADIKTMPRPLDWQGAWPPTVQNGDAFSKSVQDTAAKIRDDPTLSPEEKARETQFLTDLNDRLLRYQQSVINSGTQ